jgi:hypothetical protein
MAIGRVPITTVAVTKRIDPSLQRSAPRSMFPAMVAVLGPASGRVVRVNTWDFVVVEEHREIVKTLVVSDSIRIHGFLSSILERTETGLVLVHR